MEGARTRWTDDRLDDFGLTVRTELADLRTEVREGFRDVRHGLREDRRLMIGLFLGLYATVLVGIATAVVDAIVR